MARPRLAPIARLVDAMPERLWKPGNLYMLPGGDWHLCAGPSRDGEVVRTVEWRGRQIARGRRPFNFQAHEDVP